MFKKVHKRTGRLMEKRGISMLLNKGVLFLVYTVICQKHNRVHIYTLSYHRGCLSRDVTPGRCAHGFLEKCRMPTCAPWKRKRRRGNAVIAVRSHRTCSKQTPSCESAVGSPQQRSKVSYNAVRSP